MLNIKNPVSSDPCPTFPDIYTSEIKVYYFLVSSVTKYPNDAQFKNVAVSISLNLTHIKALLINLLLCPSITDANILTPL